MIRPSFLPSPRRPLYLIRYSGPGCIIPLAATGCGTKDGWSTIGSVAIRRIRGSQMPRLGTHTAGTSTIDSFPSLARAQSESCREG